MTGMKSMSNLMHAKELQGPSIFSKTQVMTDHEGMRSETRKFASQS